MTTISKLQPSVLWLPTVALAAVQGAITLSWVTYSVHLPTLLAQTKLTAAFAPTLLLIEALLAIVLEPVMGNIGDRLEKTNRRFPMIWVGVGLSALLFVMLFLFNQPGLFGLLPGLLIAWAITMAIFRAPAIALLRRYALTPKLPQAASLLTLAAGLAGATRPLAAPLITQLGVPLTFTLSAIALVAATAALSANHPASLPISPRPSMVSSHLLARLGLIAVVGISVTLAFRLAIETLPKILKVALPQVQPPVVVGWVFIAIAVTAIPAGLLASRIGNRRTMAIGLIGMIAAMALIPWIGSAGMAIALALVLGAAFSLVSNGTLPFALALIPPGAAGLSAGSFFGGVAIATSLFLFFSSSFAAPPFALTFGMAAIVVAAVCIALSHRLQQAELS